jgi:hypothetical protein
MFVPETYNVTSVRNSSNAFDYFEDGDLRIVFDTVIYRDSDFRFGKTFIGDNEYIFHDTTFFGNCDTFAFCNESELRLDVTLYAPADDNLNQYENFGAWVDFMDGRLDTNQLYPLSLSKLFDGYFSRSTYRTTKCVPSDECTEFTADYDNERAQSFEYTIRVNGEEKEERRLLEQENHQTSMRTILGGKNCPK